MYCHSQPAGALNTWIKLVPPNILHVMRPDGVRFVSAGVRWSTWLNTHAQTSQTPERLMISPIFIYRTILTSD